MIFDGGLVEYKLKIIIMEPSFRCTFDRLAECGITRVLKLSRTILKRIS